MYEYTIQKLTQGIECLATGAGDIRERLTDSYIYYFNLLNENDFPEKLKKDWKDIDKNIHKHKDLKITSVDKIIADCEGQLSVIRKKRNKKTAKKIVEKIFALRYQLSEIKVNSDIKI